MLGNQSTICPGGGGRGLSTNGAKKILEQYISLIKGELIPNCPLPSPPGILC